MQERKQNKDTWVGIKKIVEAKVREEWQNSMNSIEYAHEVISKGRNIAKSLVYTGEGSN